MEDLKEVIVDFYMKNKMRFKCKIEVKMYLIKGI